MIVAHKIETTTIPELTIAKSGKIRPSDDISKLLTTSRTKCFAGIRDQNMDLASCIRTTALPPPLPISPLLHPPLYPAPTHPLHSSTRMPHPNYETTRILVGKSCHDTGVIDSECTDHYTILATDIWVPPKN